MDSLSLEPSLSSSKQGIRLLPVRYYPFAYIDFNRCGRVCGSLVLIVKSPCHLDYTGRSTDEHIDKTIVKDLVSDEDAIAAKENAKKEKKQRKANQKLKDRLKAERKNVANKKREIADDDEDELIDSFAKGSRGKNKTK
jgi:hypothetical protein